MDYETKAVSRKELRLWAKLFRKICGLSESEPVDPVLLLDRLPDLEGFDDVHYEIVCDETLPSNVPAQCIRDDSGYMIQIKETAYLGAYEKHIGGHRMHIMHEIMHAYADKLGFKPIFSRTLTRSTPCYKRLEWIVMALAGEVMMPYEMTRDMPVEKMMRCFGVSKAAAEKRLKYTS